MSPQADLKLTSPLQGAHRVHIALSELQLPFEEEIIDLDTPRTPAYLDINPRGLVPSLSFNGQILTESAVVANFLADAYPSHLLPPSETTEGALKRARVAFFVDTFTGKWQSAYNKAIYSKNDEEGSLAAKEAVKVLVKELEPLLKDAKPFFGGSEKLTQVEVSACAPIRSAACGAIE
jgi:glutathione S-transferase